MISLDEAIKQAEEVANREAENAEWFDLGDDSSEMFREKHEKCRECAKEYRQLAEWLKELKQLREQTRWTPVNEGSPKVRDWYTVTRKIGSDLIVDGCFFDGINTWYKDGWINHERNCLTNIVAWMSSPEPYKESEVEE